MNATNRAANRLFLLVVGIVLVALGLVGVLLGAVPAVTHAWSGDAPGVRRGLDQAYAATTIPGTRADWIGIAVLVALAVVVALLVVFIVRQGGGHTSVLLETRGEAVASGQEGDRIVIDTAVARDLLGDALSGRPELVTSSVTTYRVRRTPVLRIAATCRRGVAPTDAQAVIESALRRLDRAVGHEVPALIELTGGFRARMAAATTRVD
ncbi:hypothetical protein [Curtobacterium sp. MCBD17_003]|uniref:hypothetical protein n=1 Tax=Curtobacterium sp. MCBD17_003 TaxID=2175667 RepID=UPI000DA79320|nr:hypothetical protein [Curtobacterium sp. MCBD17_003]WIE54335.1 hypothetical protein DEI88_014630 [Curtobacterium sp. MCBD17_003]